MKTGFRKSQKGAVAIEFALVFIIFFAVFYGLVSYSLPLVMMQSFNQATSEAVRRSVAVDPNTPNYSTVVINTANATLTQQLSWIRPIFNLVVGVLGIAEITLALALVEGEVFFVVFVDNL